MNRLRFNLDKHPYWNNDPSTRSGIDDAPQLEYDDHHIDLIADRGKEKHIEILFDRFLFPKEIDDENEYGKNRMISRTVDLTNY